MAEKGSIGKQRIPPFGRVVAIAFAGMRVRLGRSTITMGGICLALAYVVSIRISNLVSENVSMMSQAVECYDSSGGWLGTDAVYTSTLGVKQEQIAKWRGLLMARSEMDLLSRAGAQAKERGSLLPTLEDLRQGEWLDGGFTIDAVLNSGEWQKTRDAYLHERFAKTEDLKSKSARWKERRMALLTADEKKRVLERMGPDAQQKLQHERRMAKDNFRSLTERNARVIAGKLAKGLQAEGITTDLTDSKQLAQQRAASWWVMGVVLVVAIAGIVNAMLMSVSERFREIGTMKCLGSLDSFILCLFLLESLAFGVVGGLIGVAGGFCLGWVQIWFSFDWAALAVFPWGEVMLGLIKFFFGGVIVTVIGGMGPAYQAARMTPVSAMRVDQ